MVILAIFLCSQGWDYDLNKNYLTRWHIDCFNKRYRLDVDIEKGRTKWITELIYFTRREIICYSGGDSKK